MGVSRLLESVGELMDSKPSGSSATHDVYESIRADVLSCRLRPDARLKISELASRFEVSPGAVREALSRLTSEGLVVAEPQRGFRVAPISESELRDITNVRAEIESLCLRRSIVKGDVAWEARVVAAFHTLVRIAERQPDDPDRLNEAWASAHRAYHEALVSACDSPWLLRLREMLYAQSERYRRLSAPLSGFTRDVVSEHRQIVEAALAHDADLAVSLMRSHLLITSKILVDRGLVTCDGEPPRSAAAG